jgi:hypothetical protein
MACMCICAPETRDGKHRSAWALAVLVLGASACGPSERQIHGAVDTWPASIDLVQPFKPSGAATRLCLALPGNFTVGYASKHEPPVMAPGGGAVEARASVCFEGGTCRTWDRWEVSLRTDGGRRYCLSDLSGLPQGRIVSARVEASPSMRAESVWLESYTPN